MASSGIWLGDLARAVAAAGRSDPLTVRAIAELLGVTTAAEEETVRPPVTTTPDPRPRLPPPVEESGERTPQTPAPGPAVPAVATPAPGPGPQLLTPLVRGSRPPVVWTTPSLRTAARTGPPPLRQPLLAPRSASAIVQAAVSRWEPDGDVDIPRAVDRLAKGLPLSVLPRCPTPTLRFGVQVLVDRGFGMQPFYRDQDELAARIRRTVGQNTTEVLYFEDSPLGGAGPGDRWAWQTYTPPPSGTRVLILTDLGLGGPAHPRQGGRPEWERFFDGLTRASCAPVLFLPYPRHRWPSWATDRVRMVPWDRRTTVGWVRMHNA
ncbi:MAG: hypothetical protein HOV73_28765 [Streptomyces sp.]|nr:hypothetical protein [Streptomyces sp.]NUR44079.1 hypothetical protein [Streptomyces sp.]NUS14375.1 hypothetical protein [Streptomyces sp.]NUS31138.1 hypothetical protein [Streptomyces sp.]